MRKVRQLEAEQLQMQQARDAELAAKEAAFNRRKKAEAAQRERQVAEARRERSPRYLRRIGRRS